MKLLISSTNSNYNSTKIHKLPENTKNIFDRILLITPIIFGLYGVTAYFCKKNIINDNG